MTKRCSLTAPRREHAAARARQRTRNACAHMARSEAERARGWRPARRAQRKLQRKGQAASLLDQRQAFPQPRLQRLHTGSGWRTLATDRDERQGRCEVSCRHSRARVWLWSALHAGRAEPVPRRCLAVSGGTEVVVGEKRPATTVGWLNEPRLNFHHPANISGFLSRSAYSRPCSRHPRLWQPRARAPPAKQGSGTQETRAKQVDQAGQLAVVARVARCKRASASRCGDGGVAVGGGGVRGWGGAFCEIRLRTICAVESLKL